MKMELLPALLFCIYASVSFSLGTGCSRQTFFHLDDGTFSSPNFPGNYSNDLDRCGYFFTAPDNHAILITFTFFHTEGLYFGHKTDYIALSDGPLKQNPPESHYFGKLEPFSFLSLERKARFFFTSDLVDNFQGFNGTFEYLDLKKYCKISSSALVAGNATITSCQDRKGDYATSCEFTCSYPEVEGNGTAQCVNGTFDTLCRLREELVDQCEKSEFVDCPYSVEQVGTYYETFEFLPGPSPGATNEEIELENELVANVAAEIAVLEDDGGRGSRLNPCLRSYCNKFLHPIKKKSVYRFRCIKTNRVRLCFLCRYRTSCEYAPEVFD